MNTQSNAIPEYSLANRRASRLRSSRRAGACTGRCRRELWENRSIYIAPLAVAGLILFGFLISTIGLPGKMRAAFALDPMAAA